MIVLGLLLILVALGAAVFAAMAPSATSETIVVTALGVKVSASPLAMFIAGAVSVMLARPRVRPDQPWRAPQGEFAQGAA